MKSNWIWGMRVWAKKIAKAEVKWEGVWHISGREQTPLRETGTS